LAIIDSAASAHTQHNTKTTRHRHHITNTHATTDVNGKFAATAWGKKLAARAAKAATTDFDRFKAAVAKSKQGRLVRAAVNKLKKAGVSKKK
jgi:hypothetical protein